MKAPQATLDKKMINFSLHYAGVYDHINTVAACVEHLELHAVDGLGRVTPLIASFLVRVNLQHYIHNEDGITVVLTHDDQRLSLLSVENGLPAYGDPRVIFESHRTEASHFFILIAGAPFCDTSEDTGRFDVILAEQVFQKYGMESTLLIIKCNRLEGFMPSECGSMLKTYAESDLDLQFSRDLDWAIVNAERSKMSNRSLVVSVLVDGVPKTEGSATEVAGP